MYYIEMSTNINDKYTFYSLKKYETVLGNY